jgi:uncharacterized protein YybS (DUF2232 family)
MERYFGIIDNKKGIVSEIDNMIRKITLLVFGLITTFVGFFGTVSVIKNKESFVSAIKSFYEGYYGKIVFDWFLITLSFSVTVSLIAWIVEMIYLAVEYVNGNLFEDIK